MRNGRLKLIVAGLVSSVALLGTTVLAGPAHADPTPAGPLVGVKADDGATVVSTEWNQAENYLIMNIASPAVGQTLPVALLLPQGWTPDTTKKWPTIMMLPGGGGDTYLTWAGATDLRSVAKPWNVIVICPEAGPKGTYTNYFNGGKGGPPQWETFHTQEVRQIVEKAFHGNGQRAVAGLSAGGYGSMIYAARNPGMFKYAASYSGLTSIRLPAVQWAVYYEAGDKDPSARFGVPLVNAKNWQTHDPSYMAKYLKGTGLFVSSGMTGFPSNVSTLGWTPDQTIEAATYLVNQDFVLQLRLNRVPVTTDFYPLGEHAWAEWNVELKKSWPLMMNAIGATQN
ncbi:alpha/beta hydrolase [Spongisporangium articulatum]|uniref:Alpha/beta hydrolase n=1 Tax=Spongisporangium articulatum TaxID=3362603 RepID=A0ABW8AHW5_9ACTN